jgi:hypothetical protein
MTGRDVLIGAAAAALIGFVTATTAMWLTSVDRREIAARVGVEQTPDWDVRGDLYEKLAPHRYLRPGDDQTNERGRE